MTHRHKLAIVTTAAAICTALLLIPGRGLGQLPVDEKAKAALKAKLIAKNFEQNARPLTLFDRQGKVVGTVGPRALYNQPVFSPDGTRIAVVKNDPEKEAADIWALDVATGNGTQVSFSAPREGARAPVWSPDGAQIAYVAFREGSEGLYRKAANGEGAEELLYKLPGAGIVLTDWSLDGRFLSYYSTQLGESILYALPLAGERKPVELARSKSQMLAARLSPDSRFLAYRSNESGKNEVYVQTFDPARGPQAQPAGKWQISNGGLGLIHWRRDGRELYYLAADRGIMAVEVSTAPAFEFGKPRLLFKAPDSIPVQGTPGGLGSISRDGQYVVFNVPAAPPQRQITLFDRAGKVIRTVGEPGLWGQPSLSPDGSRVAVTRNDPATAWQDIWTFDVDTGKGTPVTNDQPADLNPIWSPDGKQILYASARENGNYFGIYRRAWDGSGAEELLFRYTPGAGLNLTDVSPDGKLVSFSSGGVVFVVPLTGADPLARKAIEVSREEFNTSSGRFSPDARFLAYLSDETKRAELYVRGFDASGAGPAGGKWQVTQEGAQGMIFWRHDGREVFYANVESDAVNFVLMAVDVATSPQFRSGTPRMLFRLPTGPTGPNSPGSVSGDGQRIVFTMPVQPAR